MRPIISIIAPVYNIQEYLSQCLTSICNQTFPDLEIIVVNDGSTDGSGKICDKFALKDPRIRVIHQANKGVSAARNAGLQMAQGDYLAFVDGDDWIESDMYELLLEQLVKQEADIAVCSHYKDKGGKSKARYQSGAIHALTRNDALKALAQDKWLRNYVWDKLYKRQLFENLTFPEGCIYEDLAINYQLFFRANKVVVVDTPKYHYVLRQGSALRSRYNPQKELQLFQAVCQQDAFYRQHNLWEKTPLLVVKRGIHLLDHLSMLPPSDETKHIRELVNQKIASYKNLGEKELGCSYTIKLWLQTHSPELYRKCYRMFRILFKSKKHRL